LTENTVCFNLLVTPSSSSLLSIINLKKKNPVVIENCTKVEKGGNDADEGSIMEVKWPRPLNGPAKWENESTSRL
jgi:hypothetical protein